MKFKGSFIRLLVCCMAAGVALSQARADEAPNFRLLDYNGKVHELHRADGRAVVLFFTGIGCPVARKNTGKLRELKERFGDDVTVWMIYSDGENDRETVRKEVQDLQTGEIPALIDDRQGLALALGVQRTAEVIALDAKDWTIFYRGAIDDQLSEGAEKPAPAQDFLLAALQAHLAGEPVLIAKTAAKGCLISFERTSAPGEPVSYSKQVAPILQAKCVSCHREGEIGPFAMSSYRTAKKKSRMIEEVLLTERMPPWGADPHYGKFAGAPTLSATELQTMIRWIDQGAPRDEGDESPDPLAASAPARCEWPLGTPDYVIKLPHPEEIPATGVLSYRHVHVDSPIPEDAWIGAAVVKPGTRAVLHHCVVYANFPGVVKDLGGDGAKIAVWAPGREAGRLPEGTGIFVGKGAKLDIELHYTTNGMPQTDDTQIGLYVLHEKPALAFKSVLAFNRNFVIPANSQDTQCSTTITFDKRSIIYTLTPHMHLRGSWMNYEAVYPDGRREMLLAVPRYDFNWQTVYHLAEPLIVPAGTKIVCTGGFDNSAKNPSNPDPSKVVKWGLQSWEEMFVAEAGYAVLPNETAANGR